MCETTQNAVFPGDITNQSQLAPDYRSAGNSGPIKLMQPLYLVLYNSSENVTSWKKVLIEDQLYSFTGADFLHLHQ